MITSGLASHSHLMAVGSLLPDPPARQPAYGSWRPWQAGKPAPILGAEDRMQARRSTGPGSNGREIVPDRAHGIHGQHAGCQECGREMAGFHFDSVARGRAGTPRADAAGEHGVDGAGKTVVSEFVSKAETLPLRHDLPASGVARAHGFRAEYRSAPGGLRASPSGSRPFH